MAIASESGYGAFLPTYSNEYVNREALRGQMVKQASYLTEMDQVYAQLEESARQFDIGAAEKVREYDTTLGETKREFDITSTQTEKYQTGMLGVYQQELALKEKELEEQAREFDKNLKLGWAQQATAVKTRKATEEYQEGSLALGEKELATKLEIAKIGAESKTEDYSSVSGLLSSLYGRAAEPVTTNIAPSGDLYSPGGDYSGNVSIYGESGDLEYSSDNPYGF